MNAYRAARLARQGALLVALFIVVSCDPASTPKGPTGPEPPIVICSYQVTGSTDPLPAEGGHLTLTIATASGCTWRVQPGAEWIVVESGGTGTGNGTSVLAVRANDATASRDATVTVEDQSLRVTQRGRSCSYAIAPQGDRFAAAGGGGKFTLTTSEVCSWTAMSTEGWLSLEPTSGTGTTDIRYMALANTSDASREAAILIGDQRFTVQQDGFRTSCAFSVSPVEFVLHWHGQGGEVTVATTAGCEWRVRSTTDWMTIPGPEQRSGAGVFQFTVGVFTENATRRAPIEVRWDTPSAGQNVWVTQEGCRYGMESAMTFPREGGNGQTTVVTQAISPSCSIGCPWTATSDVPWITITSQMPRAGDDVFRYVVAANPGPGVRTGRISVADRVLVITQMY